MMPFTPLPVPIGQKNNRGYVPSLPALSGLSFLHGPMMRCPRGFPCDEARSGMTGGLKRECRYSRIASSVSYWHPPLAMVTRRGLQQCVSVFVPRPNRCLLPEQIEGSRSKRS